MRLNPILIEIFKNRFAAIAEEMGVTLHRTAFSPNIKERRDFSCALFNRRADMIAQAAHIPVHLGSMPLTVKAAVEGMTFHDGDMVVVNNPFQGGTHLPDITLIAPVFLSASTPSGAPDYFVANRAHHADIGGMSAGSMPLSDSIFQEGVIIPPLKLVEQGRLNESVWRLILSNVRTPLEREGDFEAQMMANTTGVKRIKALAEEYDPATLDRYAQGLIDYAEKITCSMIRGLPDGRYEFSDVLDDDGFGREAITIRVVVTVADDRVTVDFSQSDEQVQGSLNAVYAITVSAVFYVFRTLIPEDAPTNAGLLKPIAIITRPGTVVDARFPAAVAGGNVETSQRIVDTLYGALAQALPDLIPAASQGTMNNVTIGGIDPRNGLPFAYYETIAGGMGASATQNGASGVHSHMTNTLNTPVEALEFSYPFRVQQYALRHHSGGRGATCGGDGIVRDIEMLTDVEVTVLSERRKQGPYGLSGGDRGRCGVNRIISKGRETLRPGKFSQKLKTGDRLRIETPGGGGYGYRRWSKHP